MLLTSSHAKEPPIVYHWTRIKSSLWLLISPEDPTTGASITETEDPGMNDPRSRLFLTSGRFAPEHPEDRKFGRLNDAKKAVEDIATAQGHTVRHEGD